MSYVKYSTSPGVKEKAVDVANQISQSKIVKYINSIVVAGVVPALIDLLKSSDPQLFNLVYNIIIFSPYLP